MQVAVCDLVYYLAVIATPIARMHWPNGRLALTGRFSHATLAPGVGGIQTPLRDASAPGGIGYDRDLYRQQ
jgi:hypothetical protein